jgi:hypothetical protein
MSLRRYRTLSKWQLLKKNLFSAHNLLYKAASSTWAPPKLFPKGQPVFQGAYNFHWGVIFGLLSSFLQFLFLFFQNAEMDRCLVPPRHLERLCFRAVQWKVFELALIKCLSIHTYIHTYIGLMMLRNVLPPPDECKWSEADYTSSHTINGTHVSAMLKIIQWSDARKEKK